MKKGYYKWRILSYTTFEAGIRYQGQWRPFWWPFWTDYGGPTSDRDIEKKYLLQHLARRSFRSERLVVEEGSFPE